MKREISWLRITKILTGPKTDSLSHSETRHKTFQKGDTTWVYAHGSNPVKISVFGIGFLQSDIVEGEHFEFIDTSN